MSDRPHSADYELFVRSVCGTWPGAFWNWGRGVPFRHRDPDKWMFEYSDPIWATNLDAYPRMCPADPA